MKVLILTYYWPPAGGSGVQRWLYFVKYLRKFGIEPIVFTVENSGYDIVDSSLQAQVPENTKIIRQRIWEPHHLLGRQNKKMSSGFLQTKPGFFQKIIRYIRANFFIPDARMFWIKPATKYLTGYLHKNPVDWIISTGPPHTMHLIAQNLKKNTGVRWLADFRDPWTDIDYFHQLPLTKRSLAKHQKMEKAVLDQADMVSVVSPEMQRAYQVINPNCQLLTNGFDPQNITEDIVLDTLFTFTHAGLLNADRNPVVFWEALRDIIETNADFRAKIRIHLIGKVAPEVRESIRSFQLQSYVKFTDYIPHEAVVKQQAKSQVLLLFINRVPSAKGIISGKVFEYLAAKRPILAVAPTDGDLSALLGETASGKVIGFDDLEGMKKELRRLFALYQSHSLRVSSVSIDNYKRENITAQLAKLLKNS